VSGIGDGRDVMDYQLQFSGKPPRWPVMILINRAIILPARCSSTDPSARTLPQARGVVPPPPPSSLRKIAKGGSRLAGSGAARNVRNWRHEFFAPGESGIIHVGRASSTNLHFNCPAASSGKEKLPPVESLAGSVPVLALLQAAAAAAAAHSGGLALQ